MAHSAYAQTITDATAAAAARRDQPRARTVARITNSRTWKSRLNRYPNWDTPTLPCISTGIAIRSVASSAHPTRGSRMRALNSHRNRGVVRKIPRPHQEGWRNGGSSTGVQRREEKAKKFRGGEQGDRSPG